MMMMIIFRWCRHASPIAKLSADINEQNVMLNGFCQKLLPTSPSASKVRNFALGMMSRFCSVKTMGRTYYSLQMHGLAAFHRQM